MKEYRTGLGRSEVESSREERSLDPVMSKPRISRESNKISWSREVSRDA